MEIIIGMLVGFYLFLLWKIKELTKHIKNIENDLYMISKTMENMHKHEKFKEFSKQILNG